MKPTIAVDLAKSVFEIAISKHPGKVAERHRLSRSRLLPFFAQREAAIVLFEACSSAHFWARELEPLGHQVVLLPPHLVRPYRRRHHKTDRADAKALLEAFRNAEIHPVPAKNVALQTLASLHRLRSGWLATRTARINAVRGILCELGVVIPQGASHVVPRVREILADETDHPVPRVAHEQPRALVEHAAFVDHALETRRRRPRRILVQAPVVEQPLHLQRVAWVA